MIPLLVSYINRVSQNSDARDDNGVGAGRVDKFFKPTLPAPQDDFFFIFNPPCIALHKPARHKSVPLKF